MNDSLSTNDDDDNIFEPSAMLFPDFQPSTQKILYKVVKFMTKNSDYISYCKTVISAVGIFLNIVHFIVLTRKSMRTTSVNILLASLAVHDICGMALVIYELNRMKANPKEECIPPDTMYYTTIAFLVSLLTNMVRRSSSWLAIIMATYRALVIRNLNSPRISFLTTSKCGIISVILEFGICLAFSIPFISAAYYGNSSKWTPSERCEGYPPNFTKNEYALRFHAGASRVQAILDGITMNLIPCICYPILTVVLIQGFRNAKKSIGSISKHDEGTDRATNIVIVMTVCFTIAELPQGIGYFMTGYVLKTPGFVIYGGFLYGVFAILSLINGSIHGLICFTMSSNYRKAFHQVFGFKKKNYVHNSNPTLPSSHHQVDL